MIISWVLDTDVTVKCLYGKQEGAVVRGALLRLSRFLGDIRVAVEQLNIGERMRLIVRHAFRKLIGQFGENPMELLAQDG